MNSSPKLSPAISYILYGHTLLFSSFNTSIESQRREIIEFAALQPAELQQRLTNKLLQRILRDDDESTTLTILREWYK